MMHSLLRSIKLNCDISDAKYWGYFSICGLLMRYRDLYRSEQELTPWSPIEREAIAGWIQQKEARWPELEGQDLTPLFPAGRRCDPFDYAAMNDFLNPQGYVYGAGYGMYLKPTFFLARTRSVSVVEDHLVYTTDRELVRDLFTSPAMLQGRTIFLRFEPLTALLWDHYSQLAPGRCSVLEDAFRAYGIRPGQEIDKAFEKTLEKMADASVRVLLQHELAESREAVPAWKDLLAAIQDRKAEHYLRAVQDILADTSERGPLKRIIEDRDEGALALFIGLMEGFRRMLFPELRAAYGRFTGDRNWAMIDEVRRKGYASQEAVRREVLERSAAKDRDGLLEVLRELMPG
jgi:hypothetical protein